MALLLTASISTTALAATPLQELKTQSSHMNQVYIKEKRCGLENFIKSSLEKNDNDLTKVKKDVEKHLTERRAARDEKLAKIAKKKGISVEELKNHISQKRQERLDRKAKEKGLIQKSLKRKCLNDINKKWTQWLKILESQLSS